MNNINPFTPNPVAFIVHNRLADSLEKRTHIMWSHPTKDDRYRSHRKPDVLCRGTAGERCGVKLTATDRKRKGYAYLCKVCYKAQYWAKYDRD